MSALPDPAKRLRDGIESGFAAGTERLVQGEAFGELLARCAENVAGVTKIAFDAIDLVVRNLRIAGRTDIARLSRQLGRTEDKLERVLAEIELLRDEVLPPNLEPIFEQTNGRVSTARSADPHIP